MFQQDSLPSDVNNQIANAGGKLTAKLKSIDTIFASSTDANFVSNIQKLSNVISVSSVPDIKFSTGSNSANEKLSSIPALSSLASSSGPYMPINWFLYRTGANETLNDYQGSHDTIVAVIDSGIASSATYVDHSAELPFANNLLYRTCIYKDGNGERQLYGQTPPFTQNNLPCNPYPVPSSWPGEHGTNVAAFISGGEIPYHVFSYNSPAQQFSLGKQIGLASYNIVSANYESDFQGLLVSILLSLQDITVQRQNGLPIDVVNMSFYAQTNNVTDKSGSTLMQALQRMVNRLDKDGVVLVANANNFSQSNDGNSAFAGQKEGGSPRVVNNIFPIQSPHIIIVGGTGVRPNPVTEPFISDTSFSDVLAFYSNYGGQVDLVAPGGDIGPDGTPFPELVNYTVPRLNLIFNHDCEVTATCEYQSFVNYGTSFSSPQVAAAAAIVIDLAKKQGVKLSPSQVKTILMKSARSLGSPNTYGAGMLNLPNAIAETQKIIRNK